MRELRGATVRNFAEDPPSDQVKMLCRSRTVSEKSRQGYLYPGSPLDVEAATWVRRALAYGNLRRLAHELRTLAATYYPDEVRMRARFAILALAIGAIVERRIAARKSTPRPPRRKGRGSARKARQAIDNRVYGEMAHCAVCGQEFRAAGRNWKYRIHCRPKCTNKAWMRAHPRKRA